jgi:hypothetical protein
MHCLGSPSRGSRRQTKIQFRGYHWGINRDPLSYNLLRIFGRATYSHRLSRVRIFGATYLHGESTVGTTRLSADFEWGFVGILHNPQSMGLRVATWSRGCPRLTASFLRIMVGWVWDWFVLVNFSAEFGNVHRRQEHCSSGASSLL